MKYLILCKQRIGDLAVWWRPNSAGYTVDIAEAGRYDEAEAASIARIRGEDFPVPEHHLGDVLKVRRVVSAEDANNFTLLKGYAPSAPPAQEQPK